MRDNPIPAEAHHPDRLKKAGIPLRFMGCTLASYMVTSDEQQHALDWALEFARDYEERATSALLVGKAGTGKTHLAIGIALAVAQTNYIEQILYTTVQKAIRRVKESWSSSTDTEAKAMAELTNPRLLILDEIGVQFGTEFEQNLLFDVLNDRYENLKPTILVSNLPLEEATKFLGERVIDRFREDGGQVLAFDWQSYRTEAAT